MTMNQLILPIKKQDVYGGFATLSGLTRASEDHLIVEYQVQDELFGWFDSNVIKISIPFHLIRNVTVEENWFTNKFTIHFNKLPKLRKPLKVRGNTLSFYIKKSNLEDAKKLKSHLMIAISERQLAAMDEEMDPLEASDSSVTIQDMSNPEKSPGESSSLKNMLKQD